MEIGWRSDPSNPIFLKKGSRVCRAYGSMMISAIVSSDPHFLAQDKDCETVDGEMEVQAIDRCAGERAACNSLVPLQERFSVAFITWRSAPKTITMDFLRMRPLLVIGVPILWAAKSSLRN